MQQHVVPQTFIVKTHTIPQFWQSTGSLCSTEFNSRSSPLHSHLFKVWLHSSTQNFYHQNLLQHPSDVKIKLMKALNKGRASFYCFRSNTAEQTPHKHQSVPGFKTLLKSTCTYYYSYNNSIFVRS